MEKGEHVGYLICRASSEHLPSLRRLAEVGRLVQSGPCTPLRDSDIEHWRDGTVNLTFVAVLADDPYDVVSAAMVTRASTYYRGSIAWLNGVVTHPDHEGKGLCSQIVTRLLWHAEHVWGCTRAQWECETERIRARAFYEEVIGAHLREDTSSDFELRFPWTPSERLRPFWAPL